MKLYKLILIIALTITSCESQNNSGEEVVLQWPPSPSTDVAYYKLYFLINGDTTYFYSVYNKTVWRGIPGVSAVDSSGNESPILFTTDSINTMGGVN